MALYEIPTGIMPEQIVETLPKTGEENIVYRRLVEDEILREMGVTEDFIWYDGEFHPFSFDAKIYGATFQRYQASVAETVAEMQMIIEEQNQKIIELEEQVFPKTLVSFEMSITSLVMTDLDLIDEEGNVIEASAFSTDIWEAEPVTFQSTLKPGTYYLKNSDDYALGKPNGDIQPLVCDGTEVVQLGSVEIVMIAPKKGGKK